MGCLNSIFKMWLDKNVVQGEKNIIISTESGVKDNSQIFSDGIFWDFLGVGWVMGIGGGVLVAKCWGVSNGKVLAFGRVEA